ncbi:MAG: hypothetical protein ABII00_08915 [Elusimicrobiota bacterium]
MSIIANKKRFFLGAGLLLTFLMVLALMFCPIFEGQNALQYSDALYNSISKGSAYYVPQAEGECAKFAGEPLAVSLTMDDEAQAENAARLFNAGGAETTVDGATLRVSGDLGRILKNSLGDADAMYRNDAVKISEKYRYDARRVLYDWWTALKMMDKELKRQRKFAQAKLVAFVQQKAVETAYNYYGITPQKITERVGVVIFSLIFYVVYTVWYGFAILFMFEGLGLRFKH